jgi:hypothetical protein
MHLLPESSVYGRVAAGSIIHVQGPQRCERKSSQAGRRPEGPSFSTIFGSICGRRIHEYDIDVLPTRRYSEADTGNIW